MILKIKRWLHAQNSPQEESISSNEATALLLYEAATADYELQDTEKTVMLKSLATGLALTSDEANTLFNWAKQQSLQSTSLYPFTRAINDSLNIDEKLTLLKQLWKVAYADGHIDKYEEHYIRHIADLLYLTHGQYIEAKLAVKNATGS